MRYSVDADADFVYSADCVDIWRLVHQWSFWLLWLFLTVFFITRQHTDARYRNVTDGQTDRRTDRHTGRFAISISRASILKRDKNSQKQSKQSTQQTWPLVYQSSHVYTESAEYTKSASASASAEYTKPVPLNQIYNDANVRSRTHATYTI